MNIKFRTRVDDLLVEDSRVVGVRVSDSADHLQSSTSKDLKFDAVVLAVGHSARDTYEMLLSRNVELTPKDFAVSFVIYVCCIFSGLVSSYVCVGSGWFAR